jgi:hypothetical protein
VDQLFSKIVSELCLFAPPQPFEFLSGGEIFDHGPVSLHRVFLTKRTRPFILPYQVTNQMLPKQQFQQRNIAIDNNHLEILRTILELIHLCGLNEHEWQVVLGVLKVHGIPSSTSSYPVATEIFAKLEILVRRMR